MTQDQPVDPHDAGPDREGLSAVRRALDEAEGKDSVGALPYLREAADRLTELIDESMAAAVLTGQASLRSAGAQAGLTENAVGPRLARTQTLGAYADDRRPGDGRGRRAGEVRPGVRGAAATGGGAGTDAVQAASIHLQLRERGPLPGRSHDDPSGPHPPLLPPRPQRVDAVDQDRHRGRLRRVRRRAAQDRRRVPGDAGAVRQRVRRRLLRPAARRRTRRSTCSRAARPRCSTRWAG